MSPFQEGEYILPSEIYSRESIEKSIEVFSKWCDIRVVNRTASEVRLSISRRMSRADDEPNSVVAEALNFALQVAAAQDDVG